LGISFCDFKEEGCSSIEMATHNLNVNKCPCSLWYRNKTIQGESNGILVITTNTFEKLDYIE